MQGVFINGVRPKSKKELKEVAAIEPDAISLEATSIFNNEYQGRITAPQCLDGTYTIVGPSPYDRKFYANIIKKGDKITIK